MRVRKNVYGLAAGDDTLLWYGRAVAAMKQLPSSNPRGWEYQAAIHGLEAEVPDNLTPYWAQCQHGSSFFLPWHRMYLLHFERIVATQIKALGGPADWALPYWDYSSEPAWRALPPGFRGHTLADGSPNPLFVAERRGAANAGARFLQDRDVDLEDALTADPETDGFFGGEQPGHSSGEFGQLEFTVHNRVHGRIGGLMGNPDFAALDPIFWLHHANIDRLWEVWLARDPGHHNLTTQFWLRGVSFDFHGNDGQPVSMLTADVLDLTAPALDYSYEDISDPFAMPAAVGGPPAAMPPPKPYELVGATLQPVVLDDQLRHAVLPTPVTPQAFAADTAPAGIMAGLPSQMVQKVALKLEHVTSTAHSPTYDVYLNVPDAAAPSSHEDRFVGRATMFGVVQASNPRGPHAGSGQDFAFDITDLYRQLSDAGQIDPQNLRVSFVPVDPEPGTKVSVGRISLYFA
jgi:tyrosinase